MVAGLATLSSAPLRMMVAVMRSDRHDGVLIACKAAGLKWRTVDAILRYRFAHHTVRDEDLAAAKSEFLTLSQSTATRTLRFWKARSIGGTAG